MRKKTQKKSTLTEDEINKIETKVYDEKRKKLCGGLGRECSDKALGKIKKAQKKALAAAQKKKKRDYDRERKRMTKQLLPNRLRF